MWLFLRNLMWVLLCPGTVTVCLPMLLMPMLVFPSIEIWSLKEWAGLVLILAGYTVLLSCVVRFARIGKGTLSPFDPARHLVTGGPYAITRNPMYLGVIAILLGETLFFWSGTLLVYTLIVTFVFNLFMLLYEEPWLRRKFGKEYENYCDKVGRWITFKLPFKITIKTA